MMGSGGWLDLKVAARSLRRKPGFTCAAVGILALGIGLNTALFSAIRSVVVMAPPYPDHERLVVLSLTDSSTLRPGPPRAVLWSHPEFRALQGLRLPLEASAAYAGRRLLLTGAGDAAFIQAEFVTAGYFDILGVRPVEGRTFTSEEDKEGGALVAILGHALWRERFGGAPDLIGRDVILNGRSVTVVGVAPPGFHGLTGQAELWVPVAAGTALTDPTLAESTEAYWLVGIGKVNPGVGVDLVDRRMRAAGRSIAETLPNRSVTVVKGGAAAPLSGAVVNPQARTAVLVLGGATTILLLIACANLAMLLVARATTRSEEAAVRIALGAGQWQVGRTFLVEALLLSSLGGLGGLFVAGLSLHALASLWPTRFMEGSWSLRTAGVDAVGLDPWVIFFAAGTALGTAIIFGLFPIASVGQMDPAGRLRSGVGVPQAFRRRWGVMDVLVTAEISLALVLLVGGGLLIRSLEKLQSVELGFDPEGLVIFDYSVPQGSRWKGDIDGFHGRLLEGLQSLSGVESAAVACVPPLVGHCRITSVRRAGARTWPGEAGPMIGVNYVSDDFFEALDVPILRGRSFASTDRRGTRPVVVLSAMAAAKLFPGEDPLGEDVSMRIALTSEGSPDAEVIGIVGDALFDTPARGTMPEVFVSNRQAEWYGSAVLRARSDPLAVIARVPEAVARIDPTVPLFNIRTMSDLEAGVLWDTRVLGILLTSFAALAVLLACAGVWSVVGFAVTRRTREIGLRVALGAAPPSIVATVLRQAFVLGALGLVLGGSGAWAASRLLRSVLFGVTPADPVTFLVATVLLLGVAILAAWLPARRATRIQPMVALATDR